jgi:hypothetical protein
MKAANISLADHKPKIMYTPEAGRNQLIVNPVFINMELQIHELKKDPKKRTHAHSGRSRKNKTIPKIFITATVTQTEPIGNDDHPDQKKSDKPRVCSNESGSSMRLKPHHISHIAIISSASRPPKRRVKNRRTTSFVSEPYTDIIWRI